MQTNPLLQVVLQDKLRLVKRYENDQIPRKINYTPVPREEWAVTYDGEEQEIVVDLLKLDILMDEQNYMEFFKSKKTIKWASQSSVRVYASDLENYLGYAGIKTIEISNKKLKLRGNFSTDAGTRDIFEEGDIRRLFEGRMDSDLDVIVIELNGYSLLMIAPGMGCAIACKRFIGGSSLDIRKMGTTYNYSTTTEEKDYLQNLGEATHRMFYGEYLDESKKFYHVAIPKKGKKGHRLISAPKAWYRERVEKFYEALLPLNPTGAKVPKLPYRSNGSPVPLEILSYTPKMDYIKHLSSKDLSINRVGRFCIQIDFSDFFTRITPKLLAEAFGTICGISTDGAVNGSKEDFRDLMIKSIATIGNARALYKTYCMGVEYGNPRKNNFLANIMTENIPLWKLTLADMDLDHFKETQEIKKSPGYLNEYLNKGIENNQFGHDTRTLVQAASYASYRPWKVAAIPQGAAYSGIAANLVAELLFRMTIESSVKEVLKAGGAKVTEAYIYSDNLYIFYKGDYSVDMMLKNKLVNAMNNYITSSNFGSSGMLKASKILVLDREKSDIKVLGLLIDKDGVVRLSRQYRRKVCQDMIHAAKKGRGLTPGAKGLKTWYEHVNKVTDENGKYRRDLVFLTEPEY